MAKKSERNESLTKPELVEVERITNDEFVVFPDRIVYFVDGKATVTAEERDQLKRMGVI